MSGIPEGVQTAVGEGRDLSAAIEEVAKALGVDRRRIKYKLDMSHFRSTSGRSVPKTTVRVIGWAGDESAVEEEAPRAAAEPREAREPRERREERPRREDRGERRDRGDRGERRERRDRGDRGDRGERREAAAYPARPLAEGTEAAPVTAALDDGGGFESEPRSEGLRGAEAGPTDASRFAEEWFNTLLKLMEVEGSATGTGSAERVHLHVKAERAGRIIGKRGSTLGAIRHLLRLALEKDFGDLVIDVDVADDRPREARADEPRREERGERREGGRRDRGERRDRGDRGGDRGERGDRGDRGGERGRYPEAKLRQLARKAAEKAIQTGRTITINLDLNSYDRRIVHLEISEMDGVSSRSEERDGAKYVQVIPDGATGEASAGGSEESAS